MLIYLDSSAIVKRYVLEDGTDQVQEAYNKTFQGETILAFSVWNIGEALGVLDIYRRRKWIGKENHKKARDLLVTETLRLIKLGLIKTIPLRTKLLIDSWTLIEKYHIYQADALQIISAKHIKANQFMTADQKLAEIAKTEGISANYVS
ncbi:MAG: type II toxin-antitoxin system VapC family toxin [Candidatus Bathyarchaeia archaeon]